MTCRDFELDSWPNLAQSNMLLPPVVLIGFNRPRQLAQVVDAVAAAGVPVIYFVSDGPRTNRSGEAELVSQSRRELDRLGASTEVHRIFSGTNLGCRARIQSGLDEVFSMEECAVVLEDDCVPDPSFFRYCQELLNLYRSTSKVGAVCGTNFCLPSAKASHSYSFSQYPFVWGWATWSRVWSRYDRDARSWSVRETRERVRQLLHDSTEYRFWDAAFSAIRGGFDTWDHQLALTFFDHGLLSAVPGSNLVSNVGFGPEGTHTTGSSTLDQLPVEPLVFPLVHPPAVTLNRAFDAEVARTQYRMSRLRGAKSRVRQLVPLAGREP